jgi:hypothetical protein
VARKPAYLPAIRCPVCSRDDAQRHLCSLTDDGKPLPKMCRWFDCKTCLHRTVLRIEGAKWVIARTVRLHPLSK